MRELDYDARRRPWFKGRWRSPPTRPSTGPNLTSSSPPANQAFPRRCWTAADGRRYIIDHDVPLIDLPSHPNCGSGIRASPPFRRQREDSSPCQHSAALRSPAIKAGGSSRPPESAWVKLPQPATTKGTDRSPGLALHGCQQGLVQPGPSATSTILAPVFAREDEFVPGTTGDRSVPAFIALLSLLAGPSSPSASVANLAPPNAWPGKQTDRAHGARYPVTTDAPGAKSVNWPAQETMRQRLREATHRLDEANAALERWSRSAPGAGGKPTGRPGKRNLLPGNLRQCRHRHLQSGSRSANRLRVNRALPNSPDIVPTNSWPEPPWTLAPDERERPKTRCATKSSPGRDRPLSHRGRFLHKDGHPIWADVQLTAIRRWRRARGLAAGHRPRRHRS